MPNSRKISIFFTCFLLLTPLFAGAQTVTTLDEAVNSGIRYLQGRFPKGTRAAVVAINSENRELGEYVVNRLSAGLVNGNWFNVVERNSAALQSIEREMERHLNFHVSEETELSIGKQLGAEIIISGTFSRTGQNWQLDINAIRVESAQRAGQWSSANVRSETAWASLAPQRSASIVFDGVTFANREKQTITAGLRTAMQTHKTALEFNENQTAGNGFQFTITVYRDPVNTANTNLLRAEASVSFSNNGRVLCQSGAYNITETTDALVARRISERLRDDKAFFEKVNNAIK